MAQPGTIHDFGGFPPELHRVQYPAPGSPELAAKVADLLIPVVVMMDTNWGLDHEPGPFSCTFFPVPMFQSFS